MRFVHVIAALSSNYIRCSVLSTGPLGTFPSWRLVSKNQVLIFYSLCPRLRSHGIWITKTIAYYVLPRGSSCLLKRHQHCPLRWQLGFFIKKYSFRHPGWQLGLHLGKTNTMSQLTPVHHPWWGYFLRKIAVSTRGAMLWVATGNDRLT